MVSLSSPSSPAQLGTRRGGHAGITYSDIRNRRTNMSDTRELETDLRHELREPSAEEQEAVTGGNHHVLVAMQIAKMYAAKPSIFELKPFGG
jgi:hypothetical protein